MSGGRPLPRRIGRVRVDDAAVLVGEYDGRVVALGDAAGSPIELIERWDALAPRLADDGPVLDPATLDWLPPLVPRKLLCVGSNYTDHIEEMERVVGPMKATPFPFSFLKPSSALIGSGQAVALPAYGHKLDWEAELGVVIGRPELAATDPLAAVFGYTIVNDLSLRDFIPFPHALGLDAIISKGFDGAAPIGPWITRAEHVPDPHRLRIELRVNGWARQDSSTERMIFSVAELIAYYAKVLTLEAGDVIATGTPAGVGAGMQPQEFLAADDAIEIEIEGLGVQRTTIAAAATEPTALHIH